MTDYSKPTIDRKLYLGASDIAAVMGISPWKGPIDVWAEKRGMEGLPGNEAQRIGQVLERPILMELYPARGALTFPGTQIHRRIPWAGCTPDAMEHALIEGQAVDSLCQVKVVGRGQLSRWGDPSEGEMALPAEVRLQVQWEMEVTGVSLDRVIALLGTELRVYDVFRDPELGQGLLDAAEPFWVENVLRGQMPQVDGSEGCRRVLERHFGRERLGMLPAGNQGMAWAKAYANATRRIRELEAEKEQAGNRLRLLIGDHLGIEGVFEGSEVRATWKTQPGKISYRDACHQLLTDEQVEPYRGDPIRVLRITVKEEK